MDLLLLFPPVTEATLFPYLSLPYLTGHVRRAGHTAHQVDLGVELLHDLLDAEELANWAAGREQAPDLPSWYRATVADTALAHLDEIRGFAEAKRPAPHLGPVRAVRLARQATQLPLRGSVLTRVWDDFRSLDDELQRLAGRPTASYDSATRRLHRLVQRALDRSAPRAVGISIAFFSQLAPALLIAQWIRQLRPGTPVCLGGQQVMLRHEDLADMPSVRVTVDALCPTAGEEPLERWLTYLSGRVPRHEVPGMIWLGPDGGTTSARPPTLHFKDTGAPDYSGLNIHSYLNDTVVLSMVSCVGCYWARCAFCSYGNRSLPRGTYQQGSPEQLADIVQHIVESTGIDFITVVDENTNLRLLAQTMRLVRRRGLRVRFNTRNRLEPVLLDRDFCHELAELGCEGMAVGYEGTSQRLLDALDKGLRAADFQTVLDNLFAAGIPVNLSVMGGLLDETPEEAEESLRFLTRNRGKFRADAFELMVAEPGTRLVADPRRYGLSLDTSSRFADNRELSYLGGRVGRRHTVSGGPSREEALDRLRRTIREVNSPLPRLRRQAPGDSASSLRRSTFAGPGALRLHPWISRVPARLTPDPASFLLADPVREQVYSVPEAHITQQDPDGVLAAADDRGRELLDTLLGADLGVLSEQQYPFTTPSF